MEFIYFREINKKLIWLWEGEERFKFSIVSHHDFTGVPPEVVDITSNVPQEGSTFPAPLFLNGAVWNSVQMTKHRVGSAY